MPHSLSGVCLIAEDVRRLAEFYRSVLQMDGKIDDEYSCFEAGGVVLSIFSTRGMERMAPGSTANAGTGRWTIEFQVDDVDAEYTRLAGIGVDFVKPPTTQPWGLRSVWFRDPDGNIVNFFAPVVG